VLHRGRRKQAVDDRQDDPFALPLGRDARHLE
jgi:hypothetical protein